MALILGGRPAPSRLPVMDHESCPDLALRRWHGCRPRHSMIDLIVLHWTAGEGDAQQVRRVFAERKCSAHFVIDRQGTIWQLADPLEIEAWHVAGKHTPGTNARSIGIEIVSYGIPPKWPAKTPAAGRDRRLVPTYCQRKVRSIADFYEPQTTAAISLVDDLTDALPGIPRWVPTSGGGVIPDRLPPKLAASTTGVCGHYHLSPKCDPGPRLIASIRDHFAEAETAP